MISQNQWVQSAPASATVSEAQDAEYADVFFDSGLHCAVPGQTQLNLHDSIQLNAASGGAVHEVFNFEVDVHHTYIAGGIRVHNDSGLLGRWAGELNRDLDGFLGAEKNSALDVLTDLAVAPLRMLGSIAVGAESGLQKLGEGITNSVTEFGEGNIGAGIGELVGGVTGAAHEFITGTINAGIVVLGEVVDVIDAVTGGDLEESIKGTLTSAGNMLRSGADSVVDFVSNVASGIGEAISDVGDFFSGLFEPIVLDLDGDGVELTAQNTLVSFDVDGDGYLERPAWAAADDALLVVDLGPNAIAGGDGVIDQARELSLAEWTTAQDTDLEALGALFDTNGDGAFSSADTAVIVDGQTFSWSDFRVWQDVDQDGMVDHDLQELRSLSGHAVDANGNVTSTLVNDAVNITSIGVRHLDSAGQVVAFNDATNDIEQEGSNVLGTGAFAWTDQSGASGVSDVGDIALAVNPNGFRLTGTGPSMMLEVELPDNGDVAVLFNQSAQNLSLAGTTYSGAIGDTRANQLSAAGHTVGAILMGDGGNDRLIGSGLDDVLVGDEGADSLFGGDGNDALYFDSLDAVLSGGAGADTAVYLDTVALLFSPDLHGIEVVIAGTGNDTLSVAANWAGSVVLQGNGGNDTVTGGLADDILSGDGGDDNVEGRAGLDLIFLGSGDDTGYGGAGADILDGGFGNDALYGGDGGDELYGGAGNNTLHGGNGDDLVVVNAGDIFANGAELLITGGAGIDTLQLAADAALSTSNLLYYGFEVFVGGELNDSVSAISTTDSVELFGGAGNDILGGTSLNDVLVGGDGYDLLYGNEGEDHLIAGGGGTSGWNKLFGGAGDDTYRVSSASGHSWFGGDGETSTSGIADRVIFDDMVISDFTFGTYDYGTGHLHGNSLRMYYTFATGGQAQFGFANMGQNIEAFEFADGTVLSSIQVAYADGDTLIGTSRADGLIGDAGYDTLFGGDGDDVLIAGGSSTTNWDYLFGGSGNDTYIVGDSDARTLVDHQEGIDDGIDDRVVFEDVSLSEIWFSRYTDTNEARNGDVLIFHWFSDQGVANQFRVANMGLHIESFEFADGVRRGAFGTDWNEESNKRVSNDVDGDGFADVVGFGALGTYVALGSADGTFSSVRLATEQLGANTSWGSEDYERVVGDVNGDGRADIVAFGSSVTYVALGQTDGTFANALVATQQFSSHKDNWSFEGYERTVADVNGDGRADIVGFGSSHTFVALGQADGTFADGHIATDQFAVTTNWDFSGYERLLGDVNGDGRDDIVGFGSSETYVALGQADGTFALAHVATDQFAFNTNWNFSGYERVLGDVNGDGRDDIVGFGSSETYVALGQADGTFANGHVATIQFSVANGNWGSEHYDRVVSDVNGDGRVDIVGFGYSGTFVALGQSDGTFSDGQAASSDFGYSDLFDFA